MGQITLESLSKWPRTRIEGQMATLNKAGVGADRMPGLSRKVGGKGARILSPRILVNDVGAKKLNISPRHPVIWVNGNNELIFFECFVELV
jgi:hypothetical protein